MKTFKKISEFVRKRCFWTKEYKKRKEAKWRINLYKTLDCKVVLKQWEHRSWGNNIQIIDNGRVYGHIYGVKSGDILIYEIDEKHINLCGRCKYDVGCLVEVKRPGDPADMFFAKFVRICFSNDISDVKRLINDRINELKKDL